MALISLAIQGIGAAALGIAWVLRAVVRGTLVGIGLIRARLRLAGGLHCPRGHLVPTDAEAYRCGACGFCYASGSMWICPNPECESPITSYVNCPTCGLSVSSPYRFLHS